MSLIIANSSAYRILVPYTAQQLVEYALKHNYPIEVVVQARKGARIPLSSSSPPTLTADKQEVEIRGRCRSEQYLTPKGCSLSWAPQRQKYGCYKCPGFDEAYIAMKGLIPQLTERELASFCVEKFNLNHPRPNIAENRLWNGSEGCIYEYLEEASDPEYYDFCLTCPQERMDSLLGAIKGWLAMVSKDLLPCVY